MPNSMEKKTTVVKIKKKNSDITTWGVDYRFKSDFQLDFTVTVITQITSAAV